MPLGDYCRVAGLVEDVSRRPPTPIDPVKERVEADPGVRAAARVVDKTQRDYDEATGKWEAAALAGYRARGLRAGGVEFVGADGRLQRIRPAGSSDGDVRRLADAEADADTARREAGERVIVARQALEAARVRARRQL